MDERNPLRRALPPVAIEIMSVVHAELLRTGRWPLADFVAQTLGGDHDLTAIVNSVGRFGMARYGAILTEHEGIVRPEETLRVTIAGLVQLDEGRALAEQVVDLIGDVAAKFLSLPPDPDSPNCLSMDRTSIRALLEARSGPFSPDDLKIVLQVLSQEPPGWGARDLLVADDAAKWDLTREIARYRRPSSVADYLDRVAERLGTTPGVVAAPAPAKTFNPVPLGVDAGVWAEVQDAAEAERWAEVVRAATIYLEDVVRVAASQPTTLQPKDLMTKSLGPGRPLELGSPDHPSEAEGWRDLAKGLVTALRNLSSHRRHGNNPQRALAALGIVSALVTEIKQVRPEIFDPAGHLVGGDHSSAAT